MNPVLVPDAESSLYPKLLRIFEESFPLSERRDEAAQAAAFADPRYRLEAWMDGSRLVGLMGWWDFEDFRYVEHVAVAPEARSGGYGSRILRHWLNMDPRPVYLEIEEVEDDITGRRRDFYLRLGFAQTPFGHVQPPYQLPAPSGTEAGGGPEKAAPGEGVPMQVLSWPGVLSEKQYERLFSLLRDEVWAAMTSVRI